MSTVAEDLTDLHIHRSRDALRSNFAADNRPWIIAYSGGKDSTLTLQLVYELLLDLPTAQRKPIHVLASDTRVEAPNVEAYIKASLDAIQAHADAHNLPVSTHLVQPPVEMSFWVNLIGKGYPPPTRWFRWCTSNMKIKPVRALVQDIASQNGNGSAILLLGTRYKESSQRSQGMQSRELNSRGLNPHHEIPNALVMAPIAHWDEDQVWDYLMTNNPAPWGGTHDLLWQMYRDANSGECPVVTDLNTPSCGGSRFGCWTCTVVKEDKSMKGFIAAGGEHMQGLYNFRVWLKEIREDNDRRCVYRRNGEKGNGPFTSEARKEILTRLLGLESEYGAELINDEELLKIQQEWTNEFDVSHSALRIAHRFGRHPRLGT